MAEEADEKGIMGGKGDSLISLSRGDLGRAEGPFSQRERERGGWRWSPGLSRSHTSCLAFNPIGRRQFCRARIVQQQITSFKEKKSGIIHVLTGAMGKRCAAKAPLKWLLFFKRRASALQPPLRSSCSV